MKRALFGVPAVLLGTVLSGTLLAGVSYLVSGGWSAAVSSAGEILVAATVIAVAVRTLAVVRLPISSLMHIFLMALVLGAAIAGVSPVGRLARTIPVRPDGFDQPFRDRTVYHGDNVAMFVESSRGVALTGVVLGEWDGRLAPGTPRLDWRAEVVVDLSGSRLIRAPGPDLQLDRFDVVVVRHNPQVAEAIRRDIARNVSIVQGHIDSGRTVPLPVVPVALPVTAIIAVAALCLALAAIWTPARLSRWPLANAVLVILYLRLVLLVPSLVDLIPARYVAAVPQPYLVGWAALGVASFAIAVALPPLARWRREAGVVGAPR